MAGTSSLGHEKKITHQSLIIDPVPKGLRELACDISTEVLRNQPVHIANFVADYLQDRLKERGENKIAAQNVVEDLLEADVKYEAMLEKWGVSLQKATVAAIKLQSCYRGYRTRKMILQERSRNATPLSDNKASDEENPPSHHDWTQVTNAAVVIQRHVRSLLVNNGAQEKPPGEPQNQRRRRFNSPVNNTSNALVDSVVEGPAELTTMTPSTAEEPRNTMQTQTLVSLNQITPGSRPFSPVPSTTPQGEVTAAEPRASGIQTQTLNKVSKYSTDMVSSRTDLSKIERLNVDASSVPTITAEDSNLSRSTDLIIGSHAVFKYPLPPNSDSCLVSDTETSHANVCPLPSMPEGEPKPLTDTLHLENITQDETRYEHSNTEFVCETFSIVIEQTFEPTMSVDEETKLLDIEQVVLTESSKNVEGLKCKTPDLARAIDEEIQTMIKFSQSLKASSYPKLKDSNTDLLSKNADEKIDHMPMEATRKTSSDVELSTSNSPSITSSLTDAEQCSAEPTQEAYCVEMTTSIEDLRSINEESATRVQETEKLASSPHVVAIIEDLLQTVFRITEKPRCVREKIQAALESQQAHASAGSVLENKAVVTREKLETQTREQPVQQSVAHHQSISSLGSSTSSDMLKTNCSMTTMQPPSTILIKIESEVFYQANETLSAGAMPLILDSSSNSIQTRTDSETNAMVPLSDVDMVHQSGCKVNDADANDFETSESVTESEDSLRGTGANKMQSMDERPFDVKIDDFQNV